MAKFIKPDGAEISSAPKLVLHLPKAIETGIVGYIRDFHTVEIESTQEYVLTLDITISKRELLRVGGFVPHVQPRQKIQIRAVR